jgi:4-hydroxy-2-oxoheptanedioate aldolase
MNLRERFQDTEHIVGSWVVFEDSSIAELLAEYHYDFVIVDMEHSTNGIATVNQMGQAIDAASGPTEMVVRVPWNDQVRIKRVLDVGASGILVPRVETTEEAEAVVRATRYSPEGIRGVGPLRAAKYGQEFEEYVSSANEEILVLVQIETATGVENVEDIAAIDGIDGLFIGPSDLSVSLGTFGEDDSGRFEDAVNRIIDAAHDAEIAVGTVVGSPDEIEPWLDRGVDYLSVGSDIAYLNTASERFKHTFEESIEKR